MIPYIAPPVLRLGPLEITAFHLLVLAALISGWEIAVRRAIRFGFAAQTAWTLAVGLSFIGLVSSHVFDVVFYYPEILKTNPLVLLQVWGTMSSFGGLIGGALGGLWLARRERLSPAQVLSFMDVVAFAFPFSWIFGRTGCALAHDHIGVPSTSLLAVGFPEGPRLDLGLIELLYTFVICGAFLWLDRRPRRSGFFIAAFFALYGPVRFLLDTLRTSDARYLGWTPGQYASLASTALGAFLLWRLEKPVAAAPQQG